MDCPDCGASKTKVVLTRKDKTHVKRYRLCPECEHSFATYEVEKPYLDERFAQTVHP